MHEPSLEDRFPTMRPVRSAPSLVTVNGIGLTLYGARDHDPETGTYVKTRYFSVLFIPVIALDAYRVADAPEGWYFIGREPLSGRAKVWNLFLVILAFCLAGLFWWNSYTGSPEYRARKKMAEADALAQSGQIEGAARLYREAAQTSTEQAGLAADRFKGLLQEPLDRAPLKTAAAVCKLAVSWQDRPDVRSLALERGLELAGRKGGAEPRETLAVLDTLEPLEQKQAEIARARQKVLEMLVAKEPNDIEAASALAVIYERQDEMARCEKLLAPHAARLGASEGARILGRIYTQMGKVEEAYQLLKPYADENLKRFHEAEQAYLEAKKSAEQEVLDRLRSGTAPGFPYEHFQAANDDDKQALVNEYMQSRLRENDALRAAQAGLRKYSPVVPVAFDLGILHLSRARGLTDPAARRAELEKAEKVFLAVREAVGHTKEYRLRLGQVYFWLGKQKEGQKLFDEVLTQDRRGPSTLLQVSRICREIGDLGQARKLAEEAYATGKEIQTREAAALLRALTPLDPEDEIAWLKRASSREPQTKASLNAAQAWQALRKGDEEEAIRHLHDAIAVYETMPENAAVLNNTGIAYSALYSATGDVSMLEKAEALQEKAFALQPGNSILLAHVAQNSLERAFRKLVGDAIDLTALRSVGQVDYLGYLYRDRQGRDRLAESVRKHPEVARAVSQGERLLVLAPKDSTAYRLLSPVHLFTRDLAALRRLEKALREVELDLADAVRLTLDRYAGKNKARLRQEWKGRLRLWERRTKAIRKGRSPVTFALAANTLMNLLMQGEEYDEPVDADRVVKLAEEAHAAATSRSTHANLVSALLFRAHRRLVEKEPEYARMAGRARRSLSAGHLVGVALSQGGKPREVALADRDVRRACDLLKETVAAFPDEPGPWTYVMLRHIHPEAAARVAETLRKDELELVVQAIRLKLSPVSASTALEAAWALEVAGKDTEAKEVLRARADRGVPMPFDVK